MDPWLKKVFRNVTSSSIPSIPVTKLRELKNRARHLGNDDLTDLSSESFPELDQFSGPRPLIRDSSSVFWGLWPPFSSVEPPGMFGK